VPKQKKTKSKKENDKDFDDMLADFHASDLVTARSASGTLITSSSSSGAGTDARPSMELLPSLGSKGAAGLNVAEEVIVSACIAGNLSQLRQWSHQNVQVRTAELLLRAGLSRATFNLLSCVKKIGADINGLGGNDHTALIAVAGLGNHNTVRYLVEELGADVNVPNKLGETQLYLAAARGHLAVMQVLLKLGADINRRSILCAVPLMVASAENHQDIVKWLIKAGADTQIFMNNNPKSTAALLSSFQDKQALLPSRPRTSTPRCTAPMSAAVVLAS
jgi:hypothetical protein